MAEKNNSKTTKLTPFQKETIEVAKKIVEYKLSAEANIVSIIYKKPDVLYDGNLVLEDFSNNVWRVYFQIAYDIILIERKNTLDDITVGIYLEKHSKLRAKYDEYGGFQMIQRAMQYIKVENFDGYVTELRKWKAVLGLCKRGFPVSDRLSDFSDMSAEDIYKEYEAFLNHTFVNTSEDVKSYNVFDNMYNFIEELNSSSEVGLPFYNSNILTAETGGFNINGNIYGLGAGSGVGKSTMAFNYLVPSAIEQNQKIVFIINEEDERKMKKELLIWVANNIFKTKDNELLQKRTIRDGNLSEKTLSRLKQAADWIEQKKDEHILTVIPLERYSVKTVVKIIKKYSSAFGVKIFVLDTLKESFDANTDEIYKSMMRDMVVLYDTVKPSAKNVGLFVTYQLGKGSLKMRHFTNNEIGQAKSIIDVMSVNLMMRRPYEDEYEGGSKELECFRLDGKHNKTKLPFKLKKDTNYMIMFVTKNRFGETDTYQIISECDLSTNIYRDIGYCCVPQDW